ncbi:MAG: tripartite tricarboxylate transporter TctB family protein [Oscillospiraceae bacterium]
MKVKRDQITGAGLIILGIAIAVLVSRFKMPMTAAYPGPKLFPLIAVFGFVICGLGIFLNSTFSNKPEKAFLMKEGWLKVGIAFAILCTYIFLMKYLGYLVVTPFALFAFSTLFARGGNVQSKLLYRIVFSVLFTLIIYVLYVNVFSLTLPRGLLFD